MNESLVFNGKDYDFKYALKPCGKEGDGSAPSGKCIKDAEKKCHLFNMCNLEEKQPPRPPILSQKWTKPVGPLPEITMSLPGSKFPNKQRRVKEKIKK